jgi:tRNA1Val (adenine37-N6)-methyltransferase
MPNQQFRFKQFTIAQDNTAMKVGTDGVVLGAWANIKDAERILDVGTGTGLIAIMLAQRSNALVDAVEIDSASAKQAKENVKISPWGERVFIHEESFQDFSAKTKNRYDLIVSNPPYFVNSYKSDTMARTIARHNDLLPHVALLEGISKILTKTGRFAGIFPYVEGNIFVAMAANYGLFCNKRVNVLGKKGGSVKRLLLEFSHIKEKLTEETLAIRCNDKGFSPEYIDLTKDFYLAFKKMTD